MLDGCCSMQEVPVVLGFFDIRVGSQWGGRGEDSALTLLLTHPWSEQKVG